MNKILLLLGVVIILTCNLSYAQKLDEFEKRASGNSSSEESSDCTESGDESEESSVEYEFESGDIETTLNFIGAFVDITGRILFYFPEIEGDISRIHYTAYPYADGYSGDYTHNGNKSYSIKANINYYQMNRKLTGIGIKIKLSPHPFLDFQFDYNRLREQLNDGYDQLDFASLFINFNRIKLDRFSMFWGLGVKSLIGNSKQTAFALNFGTEFYPIHPVSLSFLYNIGFFNGATIDELNLHLNVYIQRFKVFIGCQKYRAGDIDFPGLSAGIGIHL